MSSTHPRAHLLARLNVSTRLPSRVFPPTRPSRPPPCTHLEQQRRPPHAAKLRPDELRPCRRLPLPLAGGRCRVRGARCRALALLPGRYSRGWRRWRPCLPAAPPPVVLRPPPPSGAAASVPCRLAGRRSDALLLISLFLLAPWLQQHPGVLQL